jgi:hypothetical protein
LISVFCALVASQKSANLAVQKTFQDFESPIFLLLRDVVPELVLHDAQEDRPYPSVSERCAKRRGREVPSRRRIYEMFIQRNA